MPATWPRPSSAISRSSRPSICPSIDPPSTPSFTSSRPSPPTRSTRSSPSSIFSPTISSKQRPEKPLIRVDVKADFVADPFLIHHGEVWYLFFEVWNRDADKGEIGLAISRDLATWDYRGIVLREPWHLSYPHVFEFDGRIWMLPEAIDSGGVRL